MTDPSPPEPVWRLVVIDDSPEDRAEVRRLLLRGSGRRYAFAEAASGAAGVRAVLDPAAGPPDCVFLDYNLPDMTAAEVLAALTGPGGLVVCPVVVLTGATGSEMGRAVLRAGAQDYTGKDWSTPESLTRAVENAAERWRMVRRMVLDLKHREDSLRTSELQLKAALRAAKAVAFVRDARPAADAADLGPAHPDRPERLAEIRHRVHPDDRPGYDAGVAACLENGPGYRNEYRTVRPDGSVVWWEEWGTLDRGADGTPTRLTGFAKDITERKRTERALVRSVREKEVMLREIHHRVKNNLAVISSLLHLQATTIHDERSAQALREAQDRVRSMALVHEHLYNSADLGAVAFGEYARTLATWIFQTYLTPAARIELVTASDPFHLSVEQAIPCGLILNELLTNALKHAFRGRDRGEVRVALGAADGVCTVRVTDDGVGVPAGADPAAGGSLGVRLIELLSRQLDGTVEFRSAGSGTDVRLAFPIQHAGPTG
jgi:two-component sensor histidine kinase/CheY-like chemotaxis protein